MSHPDDTRSSRRSNSVPVLQGVSIGAGAFVLGLIVTYAIGQLGINRSLAVLTTFAPLDGTLIGYSALHLWPTVVGNSGMGDLLVFALLPMGILLGSGYRIASGATPGSGFRTGASVAAGYLLLTLVAYGYMLFLASGSASAQLSLDVVVQIFVTGLLFPAVFGGIGGLISVSA